MLARSEFCKPVYIVACQAHPIFVFCIYALSVLFHNFGQCSVLKGWPHIKILIWFSAGYCPYTWEAGFTGDPGPWHTTISSYYNLKMLGICLFCISSSVYGPMATNFGRKVGDGCGIACGLLSMCSGESQAWNPHWQWASYMAKHLLSLKTVSYVQRGSDQNNVTMST